MEVSFYKTLWGAVGSGTPYATFREAAPVIAAEGWDGVVFAQVARAFDPGFPPDDELTSICTDHGLGLVVTVHTWRSALDDLLAEFRINLSAAAAMNPHHIVCQTGRDSFDDAERSEFFAQALAMERDLRVVVAHETHRGRPLFNPWVTRRVLAEFPDLHVVLDASHWVTVAERLLSSEDDVLRAWGRRCAQIAARVGHEEGPQVPDPSAPEWARHVAVFTHWWQMVVAEAAAAGTQELIVVPEYGPPPYQQVTLRTGVPTTDLWATCLAERDRLSNIL